MILYLGTYPLPQSDLIFRKGGSITQIQQIHVLLRIISKVRSFFNLWQGSKDNKKGNESTHWIWILSQAMCLEYKLLEATTSKKRKASRESWLNVPS